MGIESDQLVFDYLSRVGDLAQQRQLPSGERMCLVAQLRSEIEQQRADAADTPSAVKRILGKLGTPADVVAAADGGTTGRAGSAGTAGAAGTAAPQPEVPRQAPVSPPRSGREPSPPHLASEDELGPRGAAPDWWRIEPGPFSSPGESVAGFVGGIEIPEMLKPPPRPEAAPASSPAFDGTGGEDGAKEDAGADAAGGKRSGRGSGLLLRVRWRRGDATAPRPPLSPLLLLAAVLLLAGAAFGSLVALGLGWLIAYGTRRLSPTESRWATFVLPGVVAAGGITWLWGRLEGRWGEPIQQGQMGDALTETWPVALRAAAVASALYLVWRARRPQG